MTTRDLLAICERAKAEGWELHTLAFEVFNVQKEDDIRLVEESADVMEASQKIRAQG